jgi:hypothetical protein
LIRWTSFYILTSWKRGGEMDSFLHRGQRPGVLRRVLFLNEKPHSVQQAGSMTSLKRLDLTTCSRCSRASFSRMWNILDRSRRSRGSRSSAAAIPFRRVTIGRPDKRVDLISHKVWTISLHCPWPFQDGSLQENHPCGPVLIFVEILTGKCPVSPALEGGIKGTI